MSAVTDAEVYSARSLLDATTENKRLWRHVAAAVRADCSGDAEGYAGALVSLVAIAQEQMEAIAPEEYAAKMAGWTDSGSSGIAQVFALMTRDLGTICGIAATDDIPEPYASMLSRMREEATRA